LAAREKTGKSTLLAQAVAALTTGQTFLGKDLDRAKVLWYCLDEPIADCIRRFKEMGGDQDYLTISTERPTAGEMATEAKRADAALVVVDTLTELWRGMIKSEKDADDVAIFLDPYIRHMRESNISLVFSHHTPKSGHEYRGSGAIGAKVDAILLLRRPGTGKRAEDLNEAEGDPETDDGQRILEGRGRGIPHFVHRLSFADHSYTIGKTPLSLRERILAVLLHEEATTRGIRERVRGKSQTISNTLKDMHEAGTIQKSGHLWTLTKVGSRIKDHGVGEPGSARPTGSDRSEGTAPEPARTSAGTTAEEDVELAVLGGLPVKKVREPGQLASKLERDVREAPQMPPHLLQNDLWAESGAA
jgi:hypothetical protein